MRFVALTSSLRFILLVAAAALTPATRLTAQAPIAPDTTDYNYCLGFAFSSWTPPLDLKAAGHNPIDTAHFLHAPGGRDWASSGTKAEGDTTIVLFPIWWPAGVVIALDHMPTSIADTVHGKAMALVADGRKSSPTSMIRAWEKRCS